MAAILSTWFAEDKSPCNDLSFCILVSSIVIEIKILLIDQVLDHFVHHPVVLYFSILLRWCRVSLEGATSCCDSGRELYNVMDYLVFEICATSGILKNTTFRKLLLFLSSGDEVGGTYSLNRVYVSRLLTWGRIKIQFQKLLCSLEYRTMDKRSSFRNFVFSGIQNDGQKIQFQKLCVFWNTERWTKGPVSET
jgi:hypothetical protein